MIRSLTGYDNATYTRKVDNYPTKIDIINDTLDDYT